MATNSILNVDKYIKNKKVKPKPVSASSGLLSRGNSAKMDTDDDPLAVKLKMEIAKMFENSRKA